MSQRTKLIMLSIVLAITVIILVPVWASAPQEQAQSVPEVGPYAVEVDKIPEPFSPIVLGGGKGGCAEDCMTNAECQKTCGYSYKCIKHEGSSAGSCWPV